FYKLQPHHLPGNSIFYLSCYTTFMEAYIGIRPTRETFARFFALRINSVQGVDIPAPKPPVQCGSCIISSRQGSPFFKFSGLESCRCWQGTFFYVKNNGPADLICLPPFDPAPPAKTNWSYNPKEAHNETNRIIRFMKQKMKDTGICSDDIVRTFISRRVLPLKRRAHRMSEMYGPGDPTKITGLPLSKKDVVLKAKQICQTAMPFNWKWGLLPFSTTNPPTQEAKDRFPLIEAERRGVCRKRALDSFDPDPYIFWKDLKMGKTPASRLGRSPPKPTGSSDDLVMLEIHEHVPPLRAEAGTEFVDKLMAQGQKNKRSPSDDGSSQAPPSKCFRTSPWGRRKWACAAMRASMPTASGPALKLGPRPSESEGSARTSTPPPHSSPAPPGAGNTSASLSGAQQVRGVRPLHHQITARRRIFPSSQRTKTPAPATSVPKKKMLPGRRSLQLLLSLRKRQLPRRSPPRRKVPTRVVRLPLPLLHGPSSCRHQVLLAPSLPGLPLSRHRPRPPAYQGEGDGSRRLFAAEPLGQDLGHLLPYAQWNAADITPATRGLGKDRLPAPDPIGNRSSEEHFTRLRCAVKELDSAWYDATNNLMLTADARKTLFEELLWEHRELVEAHDKCQVLPEASIDALKEQLANAQREKEQLIKQHQEELSAQKTSYQELKSQLIQMGLDHAKVLEAAEADAAAKMNEALENASNATVVLQAELEELAKARKAAEEKVARLEEERKECNQLILQTDNLAHRPFGLVRWCRTLSLSRSPQGRRQRIRGMAGSAAALERTRPSPPVPGVRARLDALTGVREGAETDLDPILAAKRQDRAYRIAEYAEMRTFIPPPHGVQDYLDEEEDEAEEEPLDDAGAGDAPPEAPAA
ncbi:hypothetical protein QYE76_056264, partial [Lolium multiflorum]